jgi:hypothetical protein
MKLTFRMNAEEFNLGMKLKLNKTKNTNKALYLFSLCIFILNILLCYATKEILSLLIFVFYIIGLLVILAIRNKSLKKQFLMSPIVNGEHTIATYDEGIEIINSYEKIFAPWQSIFCVKETPKYLFIIPTYRKGVFVIDKDRYNSDKLNELISVLKIRVNVEEGK